LSAGEADVEGVPAVAATAAYPAVGQRAVSPVRRRASHRARAVGGWSAGRVESIRYRSSRVKSARRPPWACAVADEPAEGLGDASLHLLHGGVGCVVGAERVRGCFDG